jgi:hypothetical protein
MIRILLAATVILAFTAASDAASRHRKQPRAKAVSVPQQQIYPNRPAWAPPGVCFSDDGYGRFFECGMGGKGG